MDVRIENLTKTFVGKKGVETTAVNKMSFKIPDGKLVGLLGPSGCGKSTTLYMIAGLHKPTDGHIWFGDEDVTNVWRTKCPTSRPGRRFGLAPAPRMSCSFSCLLSYSLARQPERRGRRPESMQVAVGGRVKRAGLRHRNAELRRRLGDGFRPVRREAHAPELDGNRRALRHEMKRHPRDMVLDRVRVRDLLPDRDLHLDRFAGLRRRGRRRTCRRR